MNIADALDRNTLFFPDNEALVHRDRRWTYAEFRRDADRFAHALTELGIKKGDHVCIFMGNCAEFAIAFYGILKVGATAVSVSSMCRCEEVEYMATNSEAKALVAGSDYLEEVPARSDMPSVEQVVAVESAERSSPAEVEGVDHGFWDVIRDRPEHFATVYTDRDDGAEIIYTSGTTGKPKGAVLTHGNVVSNTYSTAHQTGMSPDDRLICFLPMYHSFAQNFIFNASVNAASTLVILPKFESDDVLETLKHERITRWYAVPTIYIMMLDTPGVEEAFSTVTYCFSAASSMPGEVARQWGERLNLPINEGYGLTESTPSATYNHEFRHKEGSVGTPIENVEVQIWDDDNRPLPPGEVGQIVIKGPNVMKEYYNDPEATAETLVDGWLKTGDVGVMDEEGYFSIVDRLKDMVNSAGLKIWPREVEEVLYRHSAVSECAVVGRPDPVYGESVVACVVVRPGESLDAEEIVSFCKEKMASYKAPKVVEFMDELPKSATGKILKTDLREMVQEEDSS